MHQLECGWSSRPWRRVFLKIIYLRGPIAPQGSTCPPRAHRLHCARSAAGVAPGGLGHDSRGQLLAASKEAPECATTQRGQRQ